MKKGPIWSKTITLSLLHIVHTLWLHPNIHLQNNDNPDYVTKEDDKVNQQIIRTYAQGTTGISLNNQNIFDISRKEIMQIFTPRKRQWLASVSTARKRTKVINLSQTTPVFYMAQEKHNYTVRSKISQNPHPKNSKNGGYGITHTHLSLICGLFDHTIKQKPHHHIYNQSPINPSNTCPP